MVTRRPGNCAPLPPSLRPCAGLYEIGVYFYMFISFLPDDSLERNGSSEKGMQYGKLITDFKSLQASKLKTKK